jgi:hypothetical protein
MTKPAAPETPRTNAIDVELLRFNSGEHYGLKVVSDLNHGYLVEHARQLERELLQAQARIAELEKAFAAHLTCIVGLERALSHILWIKDCGVDGTDETGTFRNWPEMERDAMYDIAKSALKFRS